MKRIFVGGLNQETNTFCPELTGLENFRRGYYLHGEEIFAELGNTNMAVAGFADELGGREAVQLVPGVLAWALASGRVTSEAFETICGDILKSLKESRPLDGVLLSMHGAMVGENEDDCEGRLLAKIRQVVGPDVPIVCTLDYHATVTRKMVHNSDVLVGYRTYPHVDFRTTGQRGARAMARLINENIRPQATFARLGIILPVENAETGQGPMASVIRQLEELDKREEVISCSVFCTHPWMDTADQGVAFVVYDNDGPAEEYQRIGREIMEYVWDRRDEFYTEVPGIERLLEKSGKHDKPMIIVDLGDITSAGGIGDSTEILRALLSAGGDCRAALTIVDADSVEKAFAAGVGRTEEFNVGGRVDCGYNKKVRLSASVKALDEKSVRVEGESFSGLKLDMGRRARLEVHGRIELIICEKTSMVHDPAVLRSMGVCPEQCDIIVQKSHKLFRAAYAEIAKSVVAVDTPGFTDRNVRRLAFERIKRPIYPLDDVQASEIAVE